MVSERVAAIILKNKKILLVTGYDESFYWTPGGKIHSNESHESSLKRELKEELNIKLISMRPYIILTYKSTIDIPGKTQKSNYYIIDYEGIPTPQKEITKLFWYSKQNFLQKNPKIPKVVETHLIPKLIKDRLL